MASWVESCHQGSGEDESLMKIEFRKEALELTENVMVMKKICVIIRNRRGKIQDAETLSL